MRRALLIGGLYLLACAHQPVAKSSDHIPRMPGAAKPNCPGPIKYDLYFKDNFESFPCSLSQFQNLPKIVIAGEIHDWAKNANLGLRPGKLRDIDSSVAYFVRLEKEAIKGTVFLGIEGAIADAHNNSPTIDAYRKALSAGVIGFGIDDAAGFATQEFNFRVLDIFLNFELIHLRTGLPQNLESLRTYKESVGEIFALVALNQFAFEAWSNLARPFVDNRVEEFGKTVDRLACEPEGNERIRSYIQSLSEENALAIFPVIKDLNLKFSILIEQLRIHHLPVDLKTLSTNLRLLNQDPISDNSAKISDETRRIVASWRDRTMAANVAKLYCAIADEGKDLYVIVGNDHAHPILENLQKMAKISGLPNGTLRSIDTTRENFKFQK